MSPAEAKVAAASGARWGDLFPALEGTAADVEEFRRWYVFDHMPARKKQAVAPAKPAAVASENLCRAACGGLMVRTGTCETCQSCGTSSGGCG